MASKIIFVNLVVNCLILLNIFYLDAKSDYNQKTSQKDPNLN